LGFEKSQRSVTHDSLRYINILTYLLRLHYNWSAVKVQGKEIKGQGQRHKTCAKNREIINNSAAACSISLKFRRDFDQVKLGISRTFKLNGSKVEVTTWHNVSASEKRYNSSTDKLLKVKLGENYLRVER